MAFDGILDINGIKGESTRDGFAGKIAILSFSFSGRNPSTVGVNGGHGGGKGTLSSLSITKKIDSSSPTLFQKCLDGTHIASGKLTLMKSGGKPLPFLVYDLENLFISSVTHSGTDGPDDVNDEHVTIDFGKITCTFTPQKPDGGPGSAEIGSWSSLTASAK